jgi:hypothetical protein
MHPLVALFPRSRIARAAVLVVAVALATAQALVTLAAPARFLAAVAAVAVVV